MCPFRRRWTMKGCAVREPKKIRSSAFPLPRFRRSPRRMCMRPHAHWPWKDMAHCMETLVLLVNEKPDPCWRPIQTHHQWGREYSTGKQHSDTWPLHNTVHVGAETLCERIWPKPFGVIFHLSMKILRSLQLAFGSSCVSSGNTEGPERQTPKDFSRKTR